MRLLVVIPSRGRPERLTKAIEEGRRLAHGDVAYAVGLDDDDPKAHGYAYVDAETVYYGHRRTLTGWTNHIAKDLYHFMPYDFVASFGDDHIPRTEGWDVKLAEAIDGTGFSYPNDLHRTDVPQAVVASANIVHALGWFACPMMKHFYIDNVWADLGRGIGRLHYCSDVIVEHVHHSRGAQHDSTYAEAEAAGREDEAAYREYKHTRLEADIETLKGLL